MDNHCIKLVSYNVQGLCSFKKRQKIISRLLYDQSGAQPDIVCFQDTQSTGNCERNWKNNFKYDLIFSHADDTTDARGLLVGLHPGLNYSINHKLVRKSFILIDCIIEGVSYTLLNVYLNHHSSTTKMMHMLEDIWMAVEKFPNQKLIAVGDFNVVADPKLDLASHKVPEGHIARHALARKFSIFMEETGLCDTFRILNPEARRFSWHSYTCASRLDYILVSELMMNYTRSTDIRVSYCSDHSPIYCSFYSQRNPPGRGVFRFPSFLCSDPVFKEQLSVEINSFIQNNVDSVEDADKPSPPSYGTP